MSTFKRKGVRIVLFFATILINTSFLVITISLLDWRTIQPPPLPSLCTNFSEHTWEEFNFDSDSKDDVAHKVSRLWGIRKSKLGYLELTTGDPLALYWRVIRLTAPIGVHTAWFNDSVLRKIDVEWVILRPTLSQAINCLGPPDFYIAYYDNDFHAEFTLLDLIYPEKGIVVHYMSPFTSPASPEPLAEFRPDLRITVIAVVAPGTHEELVQAVYSVGFVGRNEVHKGCLSKPWPGSLDALEIASTADYYECVARGKESR